MMRRKNTSRRVQALSSDSIRSDEIAATDMALSRAGSRVGVSDMRIDAHMPGGYPRRGSHDPPAGQNQLLLRQLTAAVTDAGQSASIGTWQIRPAASRSDNQMAIKFGRPIELRDAPRREPALAAHYLDLAVRPRRNRKAEWARRLVRENVLTTDDLIWPLFVVDGHDKRSAVASMPGVERLSVDRAVRDAERAMKLNIPCIALFPYTEPSLRDEHGSEAVNSDNLVCQTVRAIKQEFPGLGVLCDVALDPYTSHGHDGLIEDGRILHVAAAAGAVRQALVQAEAGCDIIAPSATGSTAKVISTCRSWPMPRNMPPPSTARSATPSDRPRR